MHPLRALSALTLLTLLAHPATLHAQCPDVDVNLGGDLGARVGLRADLHTDADLRAAADLWARGRATFEGGAELDALVDLERAYDLSGDVRIAGMLGLSLRAANRLPEAWIALHAFLTTAPPDVRASLEARVRAALAEIEPRLGGLVLEGDFGAHGQVWLDGELVAWLPIDGAIFLAPGPARLEIRGLGRLAIAVDVDLSAGATARVSIDLPDLDPAIAGDLGLRVDWPRPEADLRAAAELAARARIAFDAGRELDALVDLERAFELSGDVRLTGMLGLALRAAGRLPDAWIALHAFLTTTLPDVRASLEARARAAIGEIEAQLGGLAIDGDFGAHGQLELDGRVIARLPIDGAIHLAPGALRITVRGDGRLAQELDATLALGQLARLRVDLPEIDASVLGRIEGLALDPSLAAAGSIPAPSGGLGFDPWPVVIVAGVAVGVLVIGGIVATVVHDNLSADLGRLDCSATPELCDATMGNIAIGEAFQFVGFIGAAVGAAVGITFAILGAVVGNVAASADTPDVDLRCDAGDEDELRAERLFDLGRRQATTGMCAPWVGDGAGAGCSLSF